MCFVAEVSEVVERAEVGVGMWVVVGDVVAVVPERGRIEGQEPERVDAEIPNVVQPLR